MLLYFDKFTAIMCFYQFIFSVYSNLEAVCLCIPNKKELVGSLASEKYFSKPC